MNYEEFNKSCFEEAKKLYKTANTDQKHVLEKLFPELKESEELEDERIRKWCISHFKECINVIKDNDEYKEYLSNKVLTWLKKQGDKIDIANKEYWRGYREGKKEMLDKYAEAEKQSEKKHKFNIGDIISNGQAVFRVDNITKNCIGQDCYFLVNIEDEKKGNRYLVLTDSQGNHHNFGETTWLCEQVDELFEKQDKQKPIKSSEWDINEFRTWQYIVSDVLTKWNGIGQYLDGGEYRTIAKKMQEEWSKKLA